MGLQQFLLFLSLAGAGTSLVCNTCAQLAVTVGDVAMNTSDAYVACTSDAQGSKTCNATAGEDTCISGYLTLSYTMSFGNVSVALAMEMQALKECAPSAITCDTAKAMLVAQLSASASTASNGESGDLPVASVSLDSCAIKQCSTDSCNTDDYTDIAAYANEVDDEEDDDESGSFSHYTVSSLVSATFLAYWLH